MSCSIDLTSQDRTHLARIQQWMQAVIMHPAGVEPGLASDAARAAIDLGPERIDEVITRSQAQTSLERLQVYARAYYARLLEVLRAEFPAVAYALGDDLFQTFAFGYLQHFPSQSYTLNDLSPRFPEYLAATRPPRDLPVENGETGNAEAPLPDWADFLVDLATLERLYSEVFDGPGVEGEQLLLADDLQGITPEHWQQSRLLPVPCLKLVTLQFPVHDYITAVHHDQQPEIPDPSRTFLVVTRRDYIVRRHAVSQPEYAALRALVEGGTIGQSLAAAASHWTDRHLDQLAEHVRHWFQSWTTAGYFQRLVPN